MNTELCYFIYTWYTKDYSSQEIQKKVERDFNIRLSRKNINILLEAYILLKHINERKNNGTN
jgi:hypothetical protein